MPRLGVGMPITAGLSQEAVTTIDDFFFESHTSGEVTPINTATRSNLFTYSHDFSQSSWTKADAAVSASTVKNPFGESATAANGPYKLTTSSCTNQSYVKETITSGIVSGTSYTLSVYAKKAEYDYVSLVALNPTTIHYFNLANGTTAFAHSIQPVIEDAGNGWYRCSVTVVSDNSSSKFFGIYLAGDSGNISLGSVADGDGVYIYGAQIEQNAPVSALITSSGEPGTATTALSDTSEVWDFDSTDIMLEADPEDEGFWEEGSNLVLNHNYEELGSELITNGDFSSGSTGWENAFGGQWVISGGKATLAVGVDGSYLRTVSNILTSGKSYKAVITTSGGLDSNNKITIYATSNTGQQIQSDGTHTKYFTADGTSFRFLGTANDRPISIDSVSVQQVDPNDRWTLGTGWTIEDGKAVGTSTTNNLQQLSILTAGDTYELTFTISDYSAGSVRANVGGVQGTLRSSNGTFTEIIGPATSPHFFFDGVSTFTGKIDNVTVKEYAITPLDV